MPPGLVLQALLEPQGSLAFQVFLDDQENQEYLVLPVHLDRQGLLDLLVHQDLLGHPVALNHLFLGFLVLMLVVWVHLSKQ
jgi:hypothetical protein